MDIAGWTPLIRAAFGNPNPEVITALIKAGADVHAKDKGGKRAIDYAKDNKNIANTEAYRQLSVGTAPSVVNAKKFGDGKYLVGKDLPAGLYKVILKDSIMKMGYVERAKSVTMGFGDILANILLLGDGYVEIKKTDMAVKLQGVEMYQISLKDLKVNIKNEVSNGIYIVGYDIKPGLYKVEVTDTIMKMGYVERSKSVAMDMQDIIANELVQGQGYVEIKKTDFAVRVQGAKLIYQD